jgi:hypothetical protein
MIDFVAILPAHDRIEIVKAAFETAVRMANLLRKDALMSDAAILAKIQTTAEQKINLAA